MNIAQFSLTSLRADHGETAAEAFQGLTNYYTPFDIDWQPKGAVVRKVEDVPAGIDEAAGEAIAALAIGAYKATVLMCRAVIEATAKEHGITNGTLVSKIDELKKQDVINKTTQEAAHEIRHLGNDMAHGDFATTSVTEIEAREVLAITEAILEEVFQRPIRIQRLREARLARKSEGDDA